MSNIHDILEACLQGLEHGADLETLLSRYPEHAQELRPTLEASIQARRMASAAPSAEVMRRGRAKFMQRAAEMREGRTAQRRREIPAFQRLAISFSMTALLLASGTGLVRASSSATPGENLYPVKRSWEGLRLFFTFDDNQRFRLEYEFENERLEEVGELISEGRSETIQFAGVFMELNGVMYVSGVPVLITENSRLPSQALGNGKAVVVTGRTNEQGIVEVILLELLPDGTVVPVGTPVEVESESDSEAGSSPGTGSGSGGESQGGDSGHENGSESSSFQMVGVVDSIAGDVIVVEGQSGDIGTARIEGDVKPGLTVEVKGYIGKDGRIIVTEIKVMREDSMDGTGSESSNSNSNDAGDGNSNDDNSNDGEDDDGGGGGNSGSGGGGDDDD